MTEHDPWSDERLAAAFAARGAGASSSAAPAGTLAATLEAVRAADGQPTSRWARWRWPAVALGALAIGVVVVGAIAVGPRLLDRTGDTGAVSFIPGPTSDVRTLDAGEFTFDYPADWVGLDSSASFSGGSSIAVLGTGLPGDACGTTQPVDIDCVNALPLGEGEIRVLVGTGDFPGGTIHDRPNLELGTTTRTEVDGEPAIVEELVPDPADPLGADLTTHLYIARPIGPSHVVTIDVLARDDEASSGTSAVTEARAALDRIMATFRYSDEARAPAVADPQSPGAS